MLGKDPSKDFVEMGHVDKKNTYTTTVEAGRRTCDEKGVWGLCGNSGLVDGEAIVETVHLNQYAK